MIRTSKDPQWVWCRRPGGVKYRLFVINSVEKLWRLECASISDDTLRVSYEIPGSVVSTGDYTPYLMQALFDFTKQNEERADRERKRRLERRNREFSRAVEAGGEWEPERAPEAPVGAAASASAGDREDRGERPAADSEDNSTGASGLLAESKAAPRKTSPRSAGGRRAKARKSASANSNRRVERAEKAE